MIVRALAGLVFLLAVLALALFTPAALFAPAGTLAWWQAWVFLGVFAAAVTAITLDRAARDPALLARRVHAGPLAEPERAQRVIQSIASLAFVAVFVVASLDHRGGWSHVPDAVAIAGDVVVAAGLASVFLVFRANTYTSAIIAVEAEQRLVTTGPYAVVRHPMYAGALAMMAGVPLALGSWWALLAVVPLAGAIVVRLHDEERVLVTSLPGYEAYRAQVRYRLVPFVW